MGIYGIFMAAGMGTGPVVGGVLADMGIYVPYFVALIFNAATFFVVLLPLKEPEELKRKPSLRDNFSMYKKHPEIIVPGIFNLIDRLHMGFKLAILPIFIKEVLGLNPSLRGMVLGINALPFILLQYPVGKISDKKGRFGMLVSGSIGFGITLSLIGYLGAFSLGALIVLYILLGIFSGITGPPSSALLGDLVEKEDNAMAMGFFNMLGNIGIIIGPVFGGLLGTFSNYVLTFLVAGLIELIALVVCLILAKRFGIVKKIGFS
ncbi:MAG: MFS transporter, partial [Candidatus Hodarchaeota archaeon]